jgi:hypothetical protein
MISSQNTISTSVANGVATVFAYDFYVKEQADITVVLLNADGTLATVGANTVAGTGTNNGGTVTFTSPPANGLTVVIYRDSYKDQDKDYVANDDFPSDSHENALDHSILLHQEAGRNLKTAVRIPIYENLELTEITKASRLSKIVGFSATGQVALYDQSAVVYVEGDILSVADMTTLEALSVSAIADGTTVQVRGYNAAGDSGGGVFELITSSDTATAILRSVFGETGKRWRRLTSNPNFANAAWYGFFPSVSDSDESLLQLAIDAHQTVFVNPGLYTLGGGVRLRDKTNLEATGVTFAFTAKTTYSGIADVLIYGIGNFGNSTTDKDSFGGKQRTSRASGTIHVDSALAVINNQNPGLNYVTCATVGDAANFAAGDQVRVSCGIDPFDADDPLWGPGDRVNEVTAIDAATGKVTLRFPLTKRINDFGWAAVGGAKFNATEMASGLTISSGDYVVDVNASKEVYKATTSGTTNATTVASDTGVTWVKVCTELGSLWTTGVGAATGRDGTPVIQKVNVPMRNVKVDGLTVMPDSSFSNSSTLFAFGFRNALNCEITNCTVKGGDKINGGVHFAEGCNECRVENFDASSIYLSGDSNRFIGCYNSSVSIKNARMSSKFKTTYPGILLESFDQLRLDNVTLVCDDTAYGNVGVAVSGGSELWSRDCQIIGYGRPIQANQGHSLDPDGYPEYFMNGYLRSLTGLTARADSNVAIRHLFNDRGSEVAGMFVGSNFEFMDISNTVFKPNRMVTISRRLCPMDAWAGLNGARKQFGPDEIEEAIGLGGESYRVWVVRANAYWAQNGNAPAGGTILCQMLVGTPGLGNGGKGVFSNTVGDSNNVMTLATTGELRGNVSLGDGTGERFFDFISSQGRFPMPNHYASGTGWVEAVYTVDTANDEIDCNTTGFAVGNSVVFFSTGGSPFAEDTVYWINSIPVSGASGSMKIASYRGGPAIDITSAGSGTRSIGLNTGYLYESLTLLIDG